MKNRRELYKSKVEDLSKADRERYQLVFDQIPLISCELAGLSILIGELDRQSRVAIDSAVKQLHKAPYRADSVVKKFSIGEV